jgi:hypothetical protein
MVSKVLGIVKSSTKIGANLDPKVLQWFAGRQLGRFGGGILGPSIGSKVDKRAGHNGRAIPV